MTMAQGVDVKAAEEAVKAIVEIAPDMAQKALYQARTTVRALGDERASDELAAVYFKAIKQSDNSFLWGVVLTETATCKNGKVQQNVHVGMLWKRATGPGGFWGLLSGTVASVAMWGWVKMDPSAIRYIALSPNAKDMAENMYRVLWSWLICVIVTVVVSLLTEPKPEKELAGLVYGCTEIPSEAQVPMYQRPMFWAVIVIVVFLILQIMFC